MAWSFEFTQSVGKRWATICFLPSIKIGFDVSLGIKVVFIGVEFLIWSLYIHGVHRYQQLREELDGWNRLSDETYQKFEEENNDKV